MGFFTRRGTSVPLRASAISCTRKGLAVVRAPIHSMSTPASRLSFTCLADATSVQTRMPSSRCTRWSQGKPAVPTPSKQPGCVRGFQMPARNMWIPKAARPRAVSITCSSLSALHGPAMHMGLGRVKNPHSVAGTISNSCAIVYLIIFLIRLASSMRLRTRSSS